MFRRKIKLFWYSANKFSNDPKIFSTHFIRKLTGTEKENYGDLLSKYLVKKISPHKIKWHNPNDVNSGKNYMAIGSILNYANNKSHIWGSGIINRKHPVLCDKVYAVRGPFTRDRMLELGINCPEIYGDPALLLPEYFKPKVKKIFRYGVAPHLVDFTRTKEVFKNIPEVEIINLATHDIKRTTKSILNCESIISSSLHGLIVAHTYNIPAVWVKFSDNLYGDDVKFYDYLASVNLEVYIPQKLECINNISELGEILNSVNNLPDAAYLNNLKKGLMESCPFI